MNTENRAHWDVVVIVLGTLTAVVALALSRAATVDLMAVIALCVAPTVTNLMTSRRVEAKVAEVRKEVNGRFSEAIAKIPDPENRPRVE